MGHPARLAETIRQSRVLCTHVFVAASNSESTFFLYFEAELSPTPRFAKGWGTRSAETIRQSRVLCTHGLVAASNSESTFFL